jgi:uncharacterized DUF497 family protein
MVISLYLDRQSQQQMNEAGVVLKFVWDSRKATANHRKHGVGFLEASTVFADPLSLTIEDAAHRIVVVVHTDRGDEIRVISARRATPKEKRQYMAKIKSDRVREIEAEYDFGGGERGRYAKRFAEGTNVIVLDPDVAEVFRNSAEVNDALRALARIAKQGRCGEPQSTR